MPGTFSLSFVNILWKAAKKIAPFSTTPDFPEITILFHEFNRVFHKIRPIAHCRAEIIFQMFENVKTGAYSC